MAYHGKKKPAKKKRVKAGYGMKKRVMAKAKPKKKRVTAMAHGMKKKKKRVMAKANGLTPAQKKLPMALQKAILKKKKKK
tara:strand:+ start:452 stop:691 length:240 start_codon:yes stop_codon:yes gene_type:complete